MKRLRQALPREQQIGAIRMQGMRIFPPMRKIDQGGDATRKRAPACRGFVAGERGLRRRGAVGGFPRPRLMCREHVYMARWGELQIR